MRSSVLHTLSTIFLLVGFLAAGGGAWILGTDSGAGGANIGAGILILFGTPLGLIGIVLALIAAVRSILRRRAPSRGRY